MKQKYYLFASIPTVELWGIIIRLVIIIVQSVKKQACKIDYNVGNKARLAYAELSSYHKYCSQMGFIAC
jgi:hypothetical protein